MSKVQKHFSFTYPLFKKKVRDGKMVREHLGDLQVEGVGYCAAPAVRSDDFGSYDADIDTVTLSGVDVRPLLIYADLMEELKEAALRYVSTNFFYPKVKEVV